jgi:hypothetical protein
MSSLQTRQVGLIAAASLAMASVGPAQTLVSPNSESFGFFGTSVSAVPDVNGDGRGEVAIGAPAENHSGLESAGRAYLYSGVGIRRLTLVSPAPRFGGEFGGAVSGLPDVNGDGFGDIGVGAYGEDGGRIYVFSGSTGVRRLTLQAPPQFTGGKFGFSIAGLADVTGDGRGDLVVGAPDAAPADGDGIVWQAGRVYVFNGFTGAMVRSLGSPNPTYWRSDFGAAVAAIPDTNGDGRAELAASDPQELVGQSINAGRVHIFSAATGSLLHTLTSPHPQHDGRFGAGVAGVPDANGDGRGDILVGAPGEIVGNNPDEAGRAYLFSGKTGQLLRQFAAGGPDAGDNFGYSVAGTMDVNGDGRGDVIIGAYRKSVPGSPRHAGRTYIYSGSTGAFLRQFQSPNQQESGLFGCSVTAMGDLNGDGRGDLAVGAVGEDVAPRTAAGRAYIIRY